jgi:two-component system CheB/CheR fusion protein
MTTRKKANSSELKGEIHPVRVGHTAEVFPIVGIGASAGGLEAFTKLLSNLPTDTGMAFVLLQHLDPNHESLSAEILSRVTKMPVTEVVDGMPALPNHVYILPPNFSIGILHGVLNLIARDEIRRQHLVIDFFFQSLAEDQKNTAIGIVLSGTGSDGTRGLMAIKAEGGITIAQTPKSAKFESMPQNAIASGMADLILSPEQIAEELTRIARHPYVAHIVPILRPETPDEPLIGPKNSLAHIFLMLRNQCHVDFTFYKANTVRRRIERRMALQKVENLKAYARFLSQNVDEVKALYAYILIHVTGFFRDPQAFEALKRDVFPKLVENRTPGASIRIWIAGCSTGEEVYSLAIAFQEFLGDKVSHTPIQIFATDISEQAIQKARLGEYPSSISTEVSPQRLGQFFVKMEAGGYKIAKSIRDICLFSRHDVTADPPFAKIDLISCRNLLIYFTAALQRHVIPIFHYSLSSHGFLWLGKSETIGAQSNLFLLVDKVNKTYSRKNVPVTLNLRFPPSTYVHGQQEIAREKKPFAAVEVDFKQIAENRVQEDYPGVLVNEQMEILQLRGRTAPFIEPAPGSPSYNLLKMAHPDLIRDLRMTLQAASKSKSSVRKEGLSFGEGRMRRTFNLNVLPIKPVPPSKTLLFLILFEKVVESKANKKVPINRKRRINKKDPLIVELQNELTESQVYQHSLVEKFESAQQDLTSTNEELQSANEEMQSTNEELETAKEELQSGNEELITVNDELQTRSLEQTQTNNDLVNLLGSVEIPIVMLSNDRKVRRFTPLAGKVLNLISTDVGRPLSDIRLNFQTPGGDLNLEEMITQAIEALTPQVVEVQDHKGRWFRLQVRPYKTIDNKIDGAVLALIDIDTLKAAKSEAEKANRAKDLFLATLSHELRTPLSSMLSWSQMLTSGSLTAEKMKRGAEIIENSAKLQAQLINDLLDVSRIVSGKLSLEMAEIDPAECIIAAIDAIRPIAEAKSIEVEALFAPNVGMVMADTVRLQQVFWNLLSNAVKFSAPESKVSVKLEHINSKDGERAKAVIKVSDSGKGIAAEFLPQIFERFSQEDDSSVRLHGGLGLGLAIVRNLVELQGGTVLAESLGDKLGATFTVTMPVISDRVVQRSPPLKSNSSLKRNSSVKSAPIRLDGLRALIVDDEANAREAFSEVLSSFGAEIKAAGSAKEGLYIFEQFRPHVLISDIAMPVEDGYSLIRKIRTLSPAQGGNTPAIAMTAYAGVDDVRRALSAGFQTHLPKPVDGLELAKAIVALAGQNADLVQS